MNVVELDFERAKTRHLLFKTRLQSIFYGSDVDQQLCLSYRKCPVGQWLYGHASKQYGHISEIQDLELVHLEIHLVATNIIDLYKQGKAEEAYARFSEMEAATNRFTDLLLIVEQKVISEGKFVSDQNISEEIRINYEELLELNRLKQDLAQRIKSKTPRDSASFINTGDSKFRSTMMQAPVGITILRGDQLVVEMANNSYLEIVDRREDELIGKPLFDALPEVKEFIEPILLDVLKTGVPYYGNEFEVILKRFGQEEKCYFNFVYQPLIEIGSEIDGIIVVATEVTAQVEAKNALQRSENQFRNLVTQSQFSKAIFKGEDFIISLANESMLRMLWRRELHEVEGKMLLDVFPELATQKFPAILRNVFKSGKTYRENEAIAFVDGPGGIKKHYLDFQYAPMFEIDGTVSGIMVSVNDVTEKVEARQQVADAADRLSLATEGTQLATWDLNLRTYNIIYSSRLAEIFGFEGRKKITHVELRSSVHPDDVHNVVEDAFATALKTGVYYYEARIIRPDKSVRWIRTQGKVLFDAGHVPSRMLGTMMDITDRKQAEIAIATSEGKFRTLADSMPQFIWTGDTEGNLNYFNKSVYSYSGLAPEQIEKEGWLQIVHPEDRAENIRLWQDSITTGNNFLFEHRFRRSDGAYRWHLSRAIAQKDANGFIQMWVGTSTDIHDSRMFIDQLEAKVQLRTKELTVANDELVKTNMELAQFAYVASHDLQEPLRKIQTFATRIVETESANLSDKGKDYFQRMQSSATRMQQLIVDLLAFSRANAVEKHFEMTDLNVVLSNVKEQLLENIQHKNAVIISDKLPVLPIIIYQFEQLFTNLIANSLKFVPVGVTPVIEITSGLIAGSKLNTPVPAIYKEYYFISFQDNGIGFDQQFKDRIFQVFQRLHNRNTYEGTGIGLAICKKIVENHHGFIDAVGHEGHGATFTIYLPSDR
ncbi:PAS domain S-box protein [Dyadobacter psychrotolerans]|uniref:histidine kinase n=1 Tax=Dyadobacter psychrotolerans TaxID=2541721 RepID=A0A4R5DWK1_9BACT|nr:PAS domain S-box protein [Dyadobacter psychrotolerans]TDE18267.1 PAS domain S-box protein [Dyadobacter psychrotolerans]